MRTILSILLLSSLVGCREEKEYEFENHSEITEHLHSGNEGYIYLISGADSTLHVTDSVCAGKQILRMQRDYFDALNKLDSINRRMVEMFNQANTQNVKVRETIL